MTVDSRGGAADGSATVVTQRFEHGPGFIFVRQRVEQHPDRAEETVRRRSEMLRRDMAATLAAAEALVGPAGA